jgi:hypothetical protein
MEERNMTKKAQTAARESRPRARGLAVGLSAALGLAAPALAFNPQPEPPAFGMVGLGRYQSASLTAVLTQPADPSHPGCGVMLSFVDETGNVLKDAAGNKFVKKYVLTGNVARSLVLRAEDILADGQTRKAIRAVVADLPDADAPTACVGMVAVFEIIAPNGWTAVVQELSISPPRDPCPPDPNDD